MKSPRRRQPETIEELLAPDRVWVTPCGCWLWLGGDDGYGDAFGRGAYGRILRPGTRRVMPVHRYVFEKFKGPIPHGYDVDHMCARWSCDVVAVRKCVNPDHLQAVPPILNQQLKMLRRMGYGTYDMDLDDAPLERPLPEDPAPLLAPGEREDDFCL
ncbi:HNH endonuclease signature motif containing protein [Afipia felis]|nr:HNH endonuclease signature motif containing protein [Afipia felis]